jgi:hypothetical protein
VAAKHKRKQKMVRQLFGFFVFALIVVAVIYREPLIEKVNELKGGDSATVAGKKESRDPRVRTKNKAEEKIDKINDMNEKKLEILEELRGGDN